VSELYAWYYCGTLTVNIPIVIGSFIIFLKGERELEPGHGGAYLHCERGNHVMLERMAM